MLSFRRCASLLRMNWAGKHGLFPLPDLIIGTLISNFLNLLVKSFCKVRSFFLAFTFLGLFCLRFQSECLGTTHLFWCLVGINVTGTLAIYSCIFLGCQLASKGIHL